ncbi:MAG: hypothetical protein ABSD73_10355, partial [Candidatus Bathyarchaeia archaeon]
MNAKNRLIMTAAIALLLMMSMTNLFFQRSPLNVSAASITGPLGVYWDANRTTPVTSVNWGSLTVGATKSLTMYVQNQGSVSGILSVTEANWQANNNSNVATFSCQQPQILPGQTVQINPSLTVFSNASGISSFSFNIVFALQTSCTLSVVAATGGTTTPAAGTYTLSLGGSTKVSATPASGYTLTGWVFNGAPYQTGNPNNPLTVSIFQAAETIQPVFTATANTGTLSIIAASGGTTTPAAGTYTYNLGAVTPG